MQRYGAQHLALEKELILWCHQRIDMKGLYVLESVVVCPPPFTVWITAFVVWRMRSLHSGILRSWRTSDLAMHGLYQRKIEEETRDLTESL